MFTVGTKVKVAGSDVTHGIGPCTGSTGYVGHVAQALLPLFGYIQTVTIFFDSFGNKAAGSRCERKKVINVIPFDTVPTKCIKSLRIKEFNILDDLMIKATGNTIAGLPKVLLTPAKPVNLTEATVLEQLCWLKSVLYVEENKYFILEWLSSKKAPTAIMDVNAMFKNFNEFMLLHRNSQIAALIENFPKMLRAYKLIIAMAETEVPLKFIELNQPGQILYKIIGNNSILKSSHDEVSYKGVLMQFCFSSYLYNYIKQMTQNYLMVSGRCTAKCCEEVDQWKKAVMLHC